MSSAKGKSNPVKRNSTQKKHYNSPKLIAFGTIAQLTQTNMAGPGTDGTMVGMRGS